MTDCLGILGLPALAHAGAQEFGTGLIKTAADKAYDELKYAALNCQGNIMQKLAVANKTEGLIVRLASMRKCLGVVSKGAGWVSGVATAWSFFVRVGFGIDAAIWATIGD